MMFYVTLLTCTFKINTRTYFMNYKKPMELKFAIMVAIGAALFLIIVILTHDNPVNYRFLKEQAALDSKSVDCNAVINWKRGDGYDTLRFIRDTGSNPFSSCPKLTSIIDEKCKNDDYIKWYTKAPNYEIYHNLKNICKDYHNRVVPTLNSTYKLPDGPGGMLTLYDHGVIIHPSDISSINFSQREGGLWILAVNVDGPNLTESYELYYGNEALFKKAMDDISRSVTFGLDEQLKLSET